MLDGATLYHVPRTSSAPVHMLVAELGLGDRVAVEMLTFEDVRSSRAFGTINPKRAVPALRLADGTVITESGAIVAILLDATGALADFSFLAKAKLWESLFYTATTVFPLCVKAFLESLKPTPDAGVVSAAADVFRDAVGPALATGLGAGPWLLSDHGGGDAPTAADFVLAKPLGNAHAMGWLAAFPSLGAWLGRVKALPSYAPAYS